MATGKEAKSVSRVLVVDSDSGTRRFFRDVLHSAIDFQVAGVYSTTEEALTSAPPLCPHLALLGIQLAGSKTCDYIKRLKRLIVGLRIIIVTSTGSADGLESALQTEIETCLVKPVSAAQCLATLRFAKHSFTDPERGILKSKIGSSDKMMSGRCTSLSERECEVMSNLADGLLYKEISDKLGLSYAMVHKYQHKIFKKLQVGNRWEAAQVWINGRSQVARRSQINAFLVISILLTNYYLG